jgi:hypothetical protein
MDSVSNQRIRFFGGYIQPAVLSDNNAGKEAASSGSLSLGGKNSNTSMNVNYRFNNRCFAETGQSRNQALLPDPNMPSGSRSEDNSENTDEGSAGSSSNVEIPILSIGIRLRRERDIDMVTDLSLFSRLPIHVRNVYAPVDTHPSENGIGGHRSATKMGQNRGAACLSPLESQSNMIVADLGGFGPTKFNVQQSLYAAIYALEVSGRECLPCPKHFLITGIREYNARRHNRTASRQQEELLTKLR